MTNPLAKHFRQPAIYIKLPSNGKFWPESALELPANGELAIYPMTVKDEIALKTPDALMNGAGVVSVIESCVPSIKDAWQVPNVDVDAIIIAIRIASYGHLMDVSSTCPECKADNLHQADLRAILDTRKMPAYHQPIQIDGLNIYLKPRSYFDTNKSNQIEFAEEQLLRSLRDVELVDEVRAIQMKQHMERIMALNYEVLVDSTNMIVTETEERVYNKDHIAEYYKNAKSEVTRTIQDKINALTSETTIQPMGVKCTTCGHEFNISLTFDYAHFFALGS